MSDMVVDKPEAVAEVASFGMTSAMIGRVSAPQGASSGFSPDLKRKREAVAELFGRAPVPPIDLPHPPPLPGGSSSSGDVHSLLVGLMSSVNEVRSSLANMATRNELQELHALQMDEVKTYVSAQLEPIKRTMVIPD